MELIQVRVDSETKAAADLPEKAIFHNAPLLFVSIIQKRRSPRNRKIDTRIPVRV